MSSVSGTEVRWAQARPDVQIRFTPWFIFLVSAGILCLAVPALLVLQTPGLPRSGAWVLSLALAVWSGIRLSIILGQGHIRLFAFFFWLFTYVFTGIAPTVQIRADQPSSTTPGISALADNAMMWTVILGVVMFEIGSFAAQMRSSRLIIRSAPDATRTGLHTGATLALLAVGLSFQAFYLGRIGLATFFESREAMAVARETAFPNPPVRAIVISLAWYPTLVAVGALLQLRRQAARWWIRTGYLALILAGTAMTAVLANPTSTTRYVAGTVYFALAVMFGAVATVARVRVSLTAIIVGLFFLFPIADAFRKSERSFERESFYGEYLGNADYDAVWQVSNALSYWSSGAAEFGRQAIGLVLFWVPRSLWPGKPTDTGILLAEYQGYDFENLSAPLWAEAMVNAGPVGVAVVFFGFGFLLNRMDSRIQGSLRTSGIWLIVAAIVPAYMLILLRGSLLQATGGLVVMVLSLLAVRRPQRSPGLTQDP